MVGFMATLRSLVHGHVRRQYFGAVGERVSEQLFDVITVVARLVGIMKGAHC